MYRKSDSQKSHQINRRLSAICRQIILGASFEFTLFKFSLTSAEKSITNNNCLISTIIMNLYLYIHPKNLMRLSIKSLFLLIILLAFTSQGLVANTMFCDVSSSGSQETTMSMEGHENHSMDMTMNQNASGDMDCCDSDCQCFIGGSTFYVSVSTFLSDIPHSNSYVQALNSAPLDRSINSLYRPPIIR